MAEHPIIVAARQAFAKLGPQAPIISINEIIEDAFNLGFVSGVEWTNRPFLDNALATDQMLKVPVDQWPKIPNFPPSPADGSITVDNPNTPRTWTTNWGISPLSTK